MLDDALRALGRKPSMTLGGDRPLAIGWATVELDRAARELGEALSVTFLDAPASVLLGASCRRSSIDVEGLHVLLLEPNTEGRLAATLARRGEGWVASWDDADRPTSAPGTRCSSQQPGPLGPERLVLDRPSRDGRHRLIVGPVAIADPGSR